MHPRLRSISVTCLAAASIAVLAGCGSSNKPAVCTDKTNFQDSINQLKDVNVASDGLGALQTQLKDVQSSATTLVASAQDQFAPQAAAFKTAIASLGTAVQTAAGSPSAASISTVAVGISGVQSAFKSLSDAVSSTC